MELFIVPLPLFDKDMVVQAYWLFEQSAKINFGGSDDFRAMQGAFSSLGMELLEEIGTEPFAGDKWLFINIKKMQLLTGYVSKLKVQPESLVCVLSGKMEDSVEILEQCARLKGQGYRLALDRFPKEGLNSQLMQYVEYLMLDQQREGFDERLKQVRAARPDLKLILTNVPDMKSFEAYLHLDGALFSGGFYNQPVTVGSGVISPVKINALQLLNQINAPDFELEDIAKIVERDPALSISLLSFINSGAVGLKQRISSIKTGVALLGQQEICRWANVAISVKLADDRPGEITKLSLVRAKFAENLAGPFELGVFQSGLFMAGLFSLLDVILQKPMPMAIKEIAVDKRVEEALVDRKGDFYRVLEIIYAYERADWDKVSILMIQNGIDAEMLGSAYVDALVWYHNLLESIDGNGAEDPS